MAPDARNKGRGWRLLVLVAGGALVVLGVGLTLPREEEAPLRPTSLGTVVVKPQVLEAPPPPEVPARPVPVEAAPVPEVATGEALSRALNEERVVLASSTRIEGLDADRPWVCAGESVTLSARVGGTPEPDAVYRWVWPGADTGAELHPGARLSWRAPKSAGRYSVRFQVCRDLGGRRVGVLAEQVMGIDVRECGAGEGQASEALRVAVTQQGSAGFAFQAVTQGPPPTEYRWDFGDGTSAVTPGPTVAKVYDTRALGADVRDFTVRLSAHDTPGRELRATAFVRVRGQPASDVPAQVTLEFEPGREPSGAEGWTSQVQVHVAEDAAVTWERVERVTVTWEDGLDTRTLPWREAVTVSEALERGGFRGHVTVRPSEVMPDVKQVVDTLHGRDAAGQEVSVSWAAFKSRAPPR
jgi:hypothetical protein